MAKGKKTRQTKGSTLTLKMVQNCVQLTRDGKRGLDLSFKEISAVPKCIQKLCDIDELDLSRNLIRKVPGFIDQFTNIWVLDLHSNYVSITCRCNLKCLLFTWCSDETASLNAGLMQPVALRENNPLDLRSARFKPKTYNTC